MALVEAVRTVGVAVAQPNGRDAQVGRVSASAPERALGRIVLSSRERKTQLLLDSFHKRLTTKHLSMAVEFVGPVAAVVVAVAEELGGGAAAVAARPQVRVPARVF